MELKFSSHVEELSIPSKTSQELRKQPVTSYLESYVLSLLSLLSVGVGLVLSSLNQNKSGGPTLQMSMAKENQTSFGSY